MLTLYKKCSDEDGDNEYPLRNFFNEFRSRHWRPDTDVIIKVKKEVEEDKLLEIRFNFECNKGQDDDSYEEVEEVEEHMSKSIYYWVTLELEKASQFKDLVKKCNKVTGKDGKKDKRTEGELADRVDELFHNIFKKYDEMITTIKSF